MLLAAMLINALYAALEDAEIPLDRVAVDATVDQLDVLRVPLSPLAGCDALSVEVGGYGC